jgi:hypothetical protein
LHYEKKLQAKKLKRAAETQETRDILFDYTKYVKNELEKQKSMERKYVIQSYYDWCVENGHYRHKYGYCE